MVRRKAQSQSRSDKTLSYDTDPLQSESPFVPETILCEILQKFMFSRSFLSPTPLRHQHFILRKIDRIDLCSHEAINSILHCLCHRQRVVKAGIQDHWNTSLLIPLLQKVEVPRI